MLKHEDLKEDVDSVIKKITAFLDIQLSEATMWIPFIVLIGETSHDVGIPAMKSDEGTEDTPSMGNLWTRRQQSGVWKKYFTVKQNEWFDDKYKHLYQDLDIEVNYD